MVGPMAMIAELDELPTLTPKQMAFVMALLQETGGTVVVDDR